MHESPTAESQDRAVSVLYRDDDFVAVSKPSGLLVHRSPICPDRDALLQRVRDHVGLRVYPIHRIDRGASGIVLFALSKSAAAWVQHALHDAGATKEYLVLARGNPPAEWVSVRPLRSPEGEPRPAHSEFRTLERFDRCALVAVRIYTGRQHQIRRHLNHDAHHVLGDTMYGKGRLNREFRERFELHRLFLHAHRVLVFHRTKATWIEIVDVLPPELERVLANLRAAASDRRPAEESAGT